MGGSRIRAKVVPGRKSNVRRTRTWAEVEQWLDVEVSPNVEYSTDEEEDGGGYESQWVADCQKRDEMVVSDESGRQVMASAGGDRETVSARDNRWVADRQKRETVSGGERWRGKERRRREKESAEEIIKERGVCRSPEEMKKKKKKEKKILFSILSFFF